MECFFSRIEASYAARPDFHFAFFSFKPKINSIDKHDKRFTYKRWPPCSHNL
jgi:hypothetical protein